MFVELILTKMAFSKSLLIYFMAVNFLMIDFISTFTEPKMRSIDSLGPVESDYLVYSTQVSVNVFDLKKPLMQSTPVLRLNKYRINVFSISYKDNLILYGKNKIYANPVGLGSNYLDLKESNKNLGVEFDGHFTVDWVDHNIYTFENKKLIIFSLFNPQYSTVINNHSREGRNLVVENVQNFIAWINNENNIVKAAKDGSDLVTVWTEPNGPIHCMTVNSRSMRFFYIVSKDRSHEKKTPTHWLTGKAEKERYKTYYLAVYSIDYDAEDDPHQESIFKISMRSTNATGIAIYYDSIFVILETPSEDDGFRVYKLIRLIMQDVNSKPEVLFPETRKAITCVQTALNIVDIVDLCKQKCPHICVHVNDNSTKCICKGGASSCNSDVPSGALSEQGAVSGSSEVNNSGSVAKFDSNALNSASTVAPVKAVQESNKTKTYLWVALGLIIPASLCIAGYFGYSYYCRGHTNEQTEESLTQDKFPGDSSGTDGVTSASAVALSENVMLDSQKMADLPLSKMGSSTKKMFGMEQKGKKITPKHKLQTHQAETILKANLKGGKNTITETSKSSLNSKSNDQTNSTQSKSNTKLNKKNKKKMWYHKVNDTFWSTIGFETSSIVDEPIPVLKIKSKTSSTNLKKKSRRASSTKKAQSKTESVAKQHTTASNTKMAANTARKEQEPSSLKKDNSTSNQAKNMEKPRKTKKAAKHSAAATKKAKTSRRTRSLRLTSMRAQPVSEHGSAYSSLPSTMNNDSCALTDLTTNDVTLGSDLSSLPSTAKTNPLALKSNTSGTIYVTNEFYTLDNDVSKKKQPKPDEIVTSEDTTGTDNSTSTNSESTSPNSN